MQTSSNLLPNEPRASGDRVQAELTARHLLPVLAELEACLLHLRAELDPVLRDRLPDKLGKAYPLGQCLEISTAMQERLGTVDEASLPPAAASGLRALRDFQRAGGSMRRVWGDLRGEYFQNAFQIGTLYVDVSNDTVTPTKPKVEILPFEEARFGAVQDFRHFARLAARYWNETAYPNHVLPAIASYCPLIHVAADGRIVLRELSDYMILLTRSRAFAPSEAVLRDAPMPQALFDRVREALQGSGQALPASPEQGRKEALAQCARARRAHTAPGVVTKVIHDVQALNQTLIAGTTPPPSTPVPTTTTHMQAIRINDTEYALDSLSSEAQAQLKAIQFVDAELARLQAHVAALQTARNAYLGALKGMLP